MCGRFSSCCAGLMSGMSRCENKSYREPRRELGERRALLSYVNPTQKPEWGGLLIPAESTVHCLILLTVKCLSCLTLKSIKYLWFVFIWAFKFFICHITSHASGSAAGLRRGSKHSLLWCLIKVVFKVTAYVYERMSNCLLYPSWLINVFGHLVAEETSINF